MKLVEDWEVEIYACDTMQERLKVIEAIQLDSFKAGMTHAAEVARPLKCYPECKSQFCEGRNSSLESILMARDTLTALPEVKP